MNDDGVMTIAGEISISKQLLEHSAAFREAYHRAFTGMLLNPPTPEQIAERRAEAQAEWDAKTAEGLVAVVDSGCYDCGSRGWERATSPDWVDKWVTVSVLEMYEAAVRHLHTTEEAFE